MTTLSCRQDLQDLLDRYVIGSHAVLAWAQELVGTVHLAIAIEDLPARVARGIGGAVPEDTPAGAWERMQETRRVAP